MTNFTRVLRRLLILGAGCFFAVGSAPQASARDYHVDAALGRDTNDGVGIASAWRSLARAGREHFQPGDRLLLKRGDRFEGTLTLRVAADAEHPVTVAAYGAGDAPPVIDAAGYRAAIRLENCRGITIEGLEITADGQVPREATPDPRCAGIYFVTSVPGKYGDVRLRGLRIHDIFSATATEENGHTYHQGYGIELDARQGGATVAGLRIESCTISRTGQTGIELRGSKVSGLVDDVAILDNTLTDVGGPGINPRRCRHVVVRGNTVERSGSSADPRMHARGSGIWPWTCEDVMIEHNRFLNARGLGDSCGIHIDFGCHDVIVQYNFSGGNEGGFVEILGDNHNCAYRYNVSVNDGLRVKGRNGAVQEGKILWFSGYVGRKQPPLGPFNSYIYNNTIYVADGGRSCFAIGGSTRGVLVANNLFVLRGATLFVKGDQEVKQEGVAPRVPGAVMTHNLYLSPATLPRFWPVADEAPVYGDPDFVHPGGFAVADYVPRRADVVRDRGVKLAPLAGDAQGIRGGLAVARDILGNAVSGPPDIGAIELP